MKEIHNITLIKGMPNHKLENNLKAYKKDQLLQIAENQQLLMKKSYTKTKIIEQLKSIIIENAANFFGQLDSNTLQILATEDNGTLQDVSYETLNSVQSAIESGYLFAYVVNSKVTLILPNELISSIESETSPNQVNEESENSTLFLRQLENARKIYGRYDLNHLVSVWNHYFTQMLTVEEATTWIKRNNND
ncbi:hypothetical protein CAR_c16080 [Carnobacterium sp. 17-4]|uniref:hypothetical protein n=1 Tax=Carnobacterium sp. (strain 17-4) TaxID=208596 RepID=UPI0002058FA2|nr:hypothetical protein [Carnobacterium sp. 17-4]AEB30266.1 hypothetical protein CAR_c16080 [Carnobacterium sp. 17-4]